MPFLPRSDSFLFGLDSQRIPYHSRVSSYPLSNFVNLITLLKPPCYFASVRDVRLCRRSFQRGTSNRGLSFHRGLINIMWEVVMILKSGRRITRATDHDPFEPLSSSHPQCSFFCSIRKCLLAAVHSNGCHMALLFVERAVLVPHTFVFHLYDQYYKYFDHFLSWVNITSFHFYAHALVDVCAA